MSHGLEWILPKETEQQTCGGGGCPKDTTGARINSKDHRTIYIGRDTQLNSCPEQVQLGEVAQSHVLVVWVSPRTVQPLENLWWCLISYMVKNYTIKILLALFFPFECFPSDCNPIFCLVCFICLSLLTAWKLPQNHKHFSISKQETIAVMTTLLFFDIKGLLILYMEPSSFGPHPSRQNLISECTINNTTNQEWRLSLESI